MSSHPQIAGWGADLDPKLRPAVPKERTPPRGIDIAWQDPERQLPHERQLKSIERPSLPAVFGTSSPPRGLSGLVRRAAFAFSEGDFRHWGLLFAADRIGVIMQKRDKKDITGE